jgi:carbon starvation protein CstA
MRKAIKKIYGKTKLFLGHHSSKIILFLVIFLLTLTSFGLGYIIAKYQEKTPLRVIGSDIGPKIAIVLTPYNSIL